MERTLGSKTREGIRTRTLIVTLDTIIAVHAPTARPKVLHFVHVLVCSAIFRYANADAIVTKQ